MNTEKKRQLSEEEIKEIMQAELNEAEEAEVLKLGFAIRGMVDALGKNAETEKLFQQWYREHFDIYFKAWIRAGVDEYFDEISLQKKLSDDSGDFDFAALAECAIRTGRPYEKDDLIHKVKHANYKTVRGALDQRNPRHLELIELMYVRDWHNAPEQTFSEVFLQTA